MEEKTEKKFFKINLIAFELVALDTPFTEREHLPSGVNMLTKSLKISVLLKQNLLRWFTFIVIKKYEKNTAVQA